MMIMRVLILIFAFPWVFFGAFANAGDDHPEQIGWVEPLSLDRGRVVVKAKVDSGALTSSINAEEIERFEKGDEDWVRFELVVKTFDGDIERIPMERPLFRNVRIKEHEGEYDRRPVVKLDFCFNNKKHTAQFNLVDRSRFLYPVLLGRRFLADRVVINPAKRYMTTAKCRYKDEPGDDDKPEPKIKGKSKSKSDEKGSDVSDKGENSGEDKPTVVEEED